MEFLDSIIRLTGMNPAAMPFITKIMVVFVPLFAVVAYGWLFIRKIARAGSAVRNMVRGLRTGRDTSLPADEVRKIAVGALYAYQQGGYVDVMNPDIARSRLDTILTEWWGIRDRADALDNIRYLSSAPSAAMLPVVAEAAKSGDIVGRERVADSVTDDKDIKEHIMQQAGNLCEVKEQLVSEGIVGSPDEIVATGVTAWDAGRLNFIARASFQKGYISEEECQDCISRAYDMACSAGYKSWKEFSDSYVLGRAIWSGNLDITPLAEDLLTKPESPWVRYPWQA